MTNRTYQQDQRISTAKKNAKGKQWYKDKADDLDTQHGNLRSSGNGETSEYKRMKVNYDLFNNILNIKDFEYVCQPFGAEAGELPATMVNRDIVSGKIKAMLGMEMKRPFSWKTVATNPEATSRREQEEFSRIKDFVTSQILSPIRQEIEQRNLAETQGRELNEEEVAQIQQKIEAELKAQTPEEVKKYMQRDHQDPAEVLSHQLLEYLIQKTDIRRKFNDAFKHLHLSAKEILYVGVLNGEPQVWNVNSLRFNSDMSEDHQFIEDGESASCEYRMTPSEVVNYFGDVLTNKEIDKIYKDFSYYAKQRVTEDLFSFKDYTEDEGNTVRVLHCVWKSLRKLQFLTYLDDAGEEQVMIVDEAYQLNEEAGDVKLEQEWIPEVYETWKIGTDIYVNMRPLPGQFKDLDNLHHCKLPYYGAVVDNMNSSPTSLMDRLKVYQYYYNIVMYRLELLLASDKGKKVMMNINAIPDSAGIDIEKWQYFFESSPFMWFDPNEEGTGYQDVNTMAKQIDLSLASDIGKYIEFAEYLKRQAGLSVGITEAVEGQIGPNDAVSNTRQSLIQSSHILEPYFEIHNHVKKNVLQALIETAKVAYSMNPPKKLTYVLDGLSTEILNVDIGLLDNSTIGLFVSNSSKAEEAKDTIRQLAHAALQNQKVELSDVISVIRQEGIVEAEETLKVAEVERREHEAQLQDRQAQQASELEDKRQAGLQKQHENEIEKIVVKEEERRKTEIIKSSIMGASFNTDMDADNDGENDFIEIAKNGLDADIKRSKNQLDREKFEHQKKTDNKKLELEGKKVKMAAQKNTGN